MLHIEQRRTSGTTPLKLPLTTFYVRGVNTSLFSVILDHTRKLQGQGQPVRAVASAVSAPSAPA